MTLTASVNFEECRLNHE